MVAKDRNVFLTGEPRVGKTTAVHEVVCRFRSQKEAKVQGVYSPEVRENGERVGFRIEPLEEGKDGEVMAHVEYDRRRSVGKYGVDESAVSSVAKSAIRTEEADLVVVDEIAPMQIYSDVFVERVRELLDSRTRVVGVVQEGSETGFIQEVKDRGVILRVTQSNRDGIPERVLSRLERLG